MTFNELIKALKKEGFEVLKSPKQKGVYQIQDIANLEGITFSESVVDYRISFWQLDDDDEMVCVQTAVKKPEDIYNFIKALTW